GQQVDVRRGNRVEGGHERWQRRRISMSALRPVGCIGRRMGDQQWQALTNGMPPAPQARAIAIHPQHPESVFVGTQRGVYRSQDGGDCWQRMQLPEGRIVWSLAFHPQNPQVMFLGTEGSDVYRSDDGGERWQYLSTIVNPDAVQMAFATRILGLAIEP